MQLSSQLNLILGMSIGHYMAKNGIAKISELKLRIPKVAERTLTEPKRKFAGCKLYYIWKEKLLTIDDIFRSVFDEKAILRREHTDKLLKIFHDLTQAGKNFNNVSTKALPTIMAAAAKLVRLALNAKNSHEQDLSDALIRCIREILKFWFSRHQQKGINCFHTGWNCALELVLSIIRVIDDQPTMVVIRESLASLVVQLMRKMMESDHPTESGSYMLKQIDLVSEAITCRYCYLMRSTNDL